MSSFSRWSAGLLVLVCLTGPLAAASLPPLNDLTGKTVTPQGSGAPTTIDLVASPTRFLAPKTHVAMLKNRQSNLTQDTAGASFPTNRTAYVTYELPGNITSVRVLFGNQTANAFTVASIAACASTQWGPTTYGTPGIGCYDGTGAQDNAWQRGSFAAGGAIADAFPIPTVAAGSTSAAGEVCGSVTGTTANTLTFAATTGIVAGMLVYTDYVNGNTILPQTSVNGTPTSTVVTVTPSFVSQPPAGTKVCFLPLGVIVAASSQPPAAAVVASDPIPINTASRPRIDSPVVIGGLVRGPAAIASGTTASSLTATQVNLSAPLTAKVAKGSSVEFCRAVTTTADTVPLSTLTLSASAPSTVVPGMLIGPRVYPITNFTHAGGFPSAVSIASVSGTTLGLSAPVDYKLYSGTGMAAYMPLVVGSAVNIGDTTITVASLPGNIATGMGITGTGPAAGAGPLYTLTTTITGIAGNVLTLSAAATGPMAVGDTFYAVVQLTLAANAYAPAVAFGSTQGILPGMHVTGTNIPASTYAASPTITQMYLTRSPTATVPSGSVLQVCDSLKTSADALPGATALPFTTTNYPLPLLGLRVNFASANAEFWPSGNAWDQGIADFTGHYGEPRVEAGLGGAGVDGVLNPGGLGNLYGAGARNNEIPIYALLFTTSDLVTTLMCVGDSHTGGDSSDASAAGLCARIADDLSTPTHPIWYSNFGKSGNVSRSFLATAKPWIVASQPSILLLQGYNYNDNGSAALFNEYEGNVDFFSKLVKGYGGVPIITTEYPRQVYGCNSLGGFAVNEPFRIQARTQQLAAANNNDRPVIDMQAPIEDPAHPGFIKPADTDDCVHLNNTGWSDELPAAEAKVGRYLAN